MSARCPEGHVSDEPDYCSVCGARILAQPAPAAAGPAAPRAAGPAGASIGQQTCPVCGEPRADDDARFCEVCRYDFQSQSAGAARPPQRPQPPPPPQPAPAPAPAPTPFAAPRRWQLEVTVDPSLDLEPDPAHPCPAGQAPSLVAVDRPEMLIGRRDDRRDIKPDLPLNDPGASRRHAKIVLSADGALALQDLASTNGTRLNGADVEPGSRRPLAHGDEVTLGRWTRIAVRGLP